jgi:hypothetical protein
MLLKKIKKQLKRLSIPELSKLVSKCVNDLFPSSESRSFTYAQINMLFAGQNLCIILNLKNMGGITADSNQIS